MVKERFRLKLGGVATGFILGWILTFCSAFAQELRELPAHSDHHMPNFFVGPFRWRVFFLLAMLVTTAIVGGAGGAICGRLALVLVRRGVAGTPLVIGLAVFGAAMGVWMAIPSTVTAGTVGVLAIVGLLGASVGVVLARKVLGSV